MSGKCTVVRQKDTRKPGRSPRPVGPLRRAEKGHQKLTCANTTPSMETWQRTTGKSDCCVCCNSQRTEGSTSRGTGLHFCANSPTLVTKHFPALVPVHQPASGCESRLLSGLAHKLPPDSKSCSSGSCSLDKLRNQLLGHISCTLPKWH